MKKYQAKGYIFESVIWRLLKQQGYIHVETSELNGRGAKHQIDAYGVLSYPTPFIYPIRLICEAKCYKDSIGLSVARNFVGVIKDISENYIVGEDHNRNTHERFTDVGCIFGSNSFVLEAQDYSWAHGIFLVSFNKVSMLSPIINKIHNFTESNKFSESMSINDLRDAFWRDYEQNDRLDDIALVVSIIDGIYPIILVGKNDWLSHLDSVIPLEREEVNVEKVNREDSEYDSRFILSIKDREVYFVLPKVIAYKIIERIKSVEKGDKIFEIDLPYISKRGDNSIRRIFKINVILRKEEKQSYVKELEDTIKVHDSWIIERRDKKGNVIDREETT